MAVASPGLERTVQQQTLLEGRQMEKKWFYPGLEILRPLRDYGVT